MINYKKSGIYSIQNTVDKKLYIGSAVNLHVRWQQHISTLKLNCHPNQYIQSSWNKHGRENFEFKVLEYVEIDKLIEREQYWIDQTKCYDRETGYNVRKIAENNIGVKCKDETKKKLSKLLTGRKASLETRAKMSAWQIGRKMSAKAKFNMAQSTRNFEKWPCENAAQCKCRNCKDKKNQIMKDYKKRKTVELFVKRASEYICGQMGLV